MINLVLVEDQTLVRQGLHSMLDLAGDLRVIGEAEDGLQALELLARITPDVVLLDIRMPHLDGLGVLQRLSARGTPPPILVLTTFDDDELILACVEAGARGFLLKDVALPQLLQAIRTVASGGRWLQPTVTARVLRGLEAFRAAEPFTPQAQVTLTDREGDVLRLMAGGYSNREIAGALRTTEGTVKSYVSNVLSKLGVRDRTRAVLKALEQGLL